MTPKFYEKSMTSSLSSDSSTKRTVVHIQNKIAYSHAFVIALIRGEEQDINSVNNGDSREGVRGVLMQEVHYPGVACMAPWQT